MHIEAFREYCLSKQAVTEETPFGPDTLVFKVCGKMFALTDIVNFESVNLKCDPEKAALLREEYPGKVLPGYHMNKKHWNTILMNAGFPDALIKEWVDDSYNLVVVGLPRREREAMERYSE